MTEVPVPKCHKTSNAAKIIFLAPLLSALVTALIIFVFAEWAQLDGTSLLVGIAVAVVASFWTHWSVVASELRKVSKQCYALGQKSTAVDTPSS